jgi:hypothetical protein
MIHNDPVFPWNGPSDASTNINGGTLISQNVNNIQRRSETGEFCHCRDYRMNLNSKKAFIFFIAP